MSKFESTVGTRTLSLSDGGEVVISLGIPTPEAEGEYHCSYEIAGLQEAAKGQVIGSDALQAIQLALVRIGAILYTSEEWESHLLSWDGEKDLGFPLPNSIRDLWP